MTDEKKTIRILRVYYTYDNDSRTLWSLIRLQGKWLQNLGFSPGTRIAVEEQNGTLLIEAMPDGEGGNHGYARL